MNLPPSGPFRRRPAAGRSGGLSLVELLVVLAILALLAGLLLPVLGRSGGMARRAICSSRVGQWSRTLQLYAADNADLLPRESYVAFGVTLNLWAEVGSARAYDVWYNALARTAGVPPAFSYVGDSRRPDFYSRRLLFHCPDARFPARAPRDGNAYFSLAMNSKLIMRPNRVVKLAWVREPSRTVVFLENRQRDEAPVDRFQVPTELGQPSAYANRFVARHQSRGHLAFADGHVELRAGGEVVTNGLAPFPPGSILWTADPAQDPNVY